MTPLKAYLRIALVASIVIYLIFLGYQIAIGNEPFPFAAYLVVYAFIFGQLPSFILLFLIFISKSLQRQTAVFWETFKWESYLLLISIFVLGIYALSIIYLSSIITQRSLF